MEHAQDSDRRVTVLLVDDHPIVRSGIRALLNAQSAISVVGEASDGIEMLNFLGAMRPDVVVLDLEMPKLGGIEAMSRIKASWPQLKVLALSAHEGASFVQQALAAGVSGYLPKRAAHEELLRAIRAVAVGGLYLDPALAAYAVPGKLGAANVGPRLSEREREVLILLAEGHANKEIANKLAISPRTLETYRARAMDKLGLKSRVDIVRYALQQGWLPG